MIGQSDQDHKCQTLMQSWTHLDSLNLNFPAEIIQQVEEKAQLSRLLLNSIVKTSVQDSPSLCQQNKHFLSSFYSGFKPSFYIIGLPINASSLFAHQLLVSHSYGFTQPVLDGTPSKIAVKQTRFPSTQYWQSEDFSKWGQHLQLSQFSRAKRENLFGLIWKQNFFF